MKRQLIAAALAILLSAPLAAADAPTTVFSAVIRARDSQSAAAMAGVATFTVDDRSIRYSVEIGGLKEVTNIVLMVQNRALNLYAGPATERFNTAASGILTENDLGGMPLAQLVREMEAGKASVAVFTVTLAGGSIGGRVERVGEELPELNVPDIKVSMPTTT